MSAGAGQTLCLICRTQGLRAALSVGPTGGCLEDAVQLAVCGCLAVDGLPEGVGRGDWVQPMCGVGPGGHCAGSVCEQARVGARRAQARAAERLQRSVVLQNTRASQGRPRQTCPPNPARAKGIRAGALAGSSNCRPKGKLPWESRASGGHPLGGLVWTGNLWTPLASPGAADCGQCLQRGRFCLPRDPQCLPEGPSTPTEWLVTPVTDPWLCPRTMHGDKGLCLHAPGSRSQER